LSSAQNASQQLLLFCAVLLAEDADVSTWVGQINVVKYLEPIIKKLKYQSETRASDCSDLAQY
jgi:hypothetical protein